MKKISIIKKTELLKCEETRRSINETLKQTIVKTDKIEPKTPYECWCMPCIMCVYYINKKCYHPECEPNSPLYPKTKEDGKTEI